MFPTELYALISAPDAEFPDITYNLFITAYMASLLEIRKTKDAFYFFAAMNLVNAYVKKQDIPEELKRKYTFKKYVARGCEQVLVKEIKDVHVYLSPDVTYVKIWGVQFSFHNIVLSRLLKQFMHSPGNQVQEWAGVRLQPPAALIFEWALQHSVPDGWARIAKREV